MCDEQADQEEEEAAQECRTLSFVDFSGEGCATIWREVLGRTEELIEKDLFIEIDQIEFILCTSIFLNYILRLMQS